MCRNSLNWGATNTNRGQFAATALTSSNVGANNARATTNLNLSLPFQGTCMKNLFYITAVVGLLFGAGGQPANSAVIDWATWNSPVIQNVPTGGLITGTAGSAAISYTGELLSLSFDPTYTPTSSWVGGT